MREKKKKNIFQRITRVFVVLVVIGLILWGALYAVNYMLGEEKIENPICLKFTTKPPVWKPREIPPASR